MSRSGVNRDESDFPGNIFFDGHGPSPAQIAEEAIRRTEERLRQYIQKKFEEIVADQAKADEIKKSLDDIVHNEVAVNFNSTFYDRFFSDSMEGKKSAMRGRVKLSRDYKEFAKNSIIMQHVEGYGEGDKEVAAGKLLDLILDHYLEGIVQDIIRYSYGRHIDRHTVNPHTENNIYAILEQIRSKKVHIADIKKNLDKLGKDLGEFIDVGRSGGEVIKEKVGLMLLSEAIINDRVDVVRALLDKGVEFNKNFSSKRTPLFCVIRKRGAGQVNKKEMIDLLLERFGSDTQRIEYLNKRDLRGESALMYAAFHGDLEALDIISTKMLDLGMNLSEIKRLDGLNAVDIAAESGNFDAVLLLLKRGAFPGDAFKMLSKAIGAESSTVIKEIIDRVLIRDFKDEDLQAFLKSELGKVNRNPKHVDTLNLLLSAYIKKYKDEPEKLKKIISPDILTGFYLEIHRFMQSKEICAVSNLDFLTNLDPEIGKSIADYLNKLSKLSMNQVSRSMYVYLTSKTFSDKFGEVSFRKDIPGEVLKTDASLIAMKYILSTKDFDFKRVKLEIEKDVKSKDYNENHIRLALWTSKQVDEKLKTVGVLDDEKRFDIAAGVFGLLMDQKSAVSTQQKDSETVRRYLISRHDLCGIVGPEHEGAVDVVFGILDGFGLTAGHYVPQTQNPKTKSIAGTVRDAANRLREGLGRIFGSKPESEPEFLQDEPEIGSLAGPAPEPRAKTNTAEEERRRTEAIVIQLRREKEQRMADEKFMKEQLAREKVAFEERQRQRAAEAATRQKEEEEKRRVEDLVKEFASLDPIPQHVPMPDPHRVDDIARPVQQPRDRVLARPS